MISLTILALPLGLMTGFGTQIVPMTIFVTLTAATLQTGLS